MLEDALIHAVDEALESPSASPIGAEIQDRWQRQERECRRFQQEHVCERAHIKVGVPL